MRVFSQHVHKNTDTVKMEETLERTGSGVEVCEAVAHAECR